jgi:hypothetical protein
MTWRSAALWVALLGLCFSLHAQAMQQTAIVSGRVYNEAAPIPGLTVSIAHPKLGRSVPVVTNSDGHFRVGGVPLGDDYFLEVYWGSELKYRQPLAVRQTEVVVPSIRLTDRKDPGGKPGPLRLQDAVPLLQRAALQGFAPIRGRYMGSLDDEGQTRTYELTVEIDGAQSGALMVPKDGESYVAYSLFRSTSPEEPVRGQALKVFDATTATLNGAFPSSWSRKSTRPKTESELSGGAWSLFTGTEGVSFRVALNPFPTGGYRVTLFVSASGRSAAK